MSETAETASSAAGDPDAVERLSLAEIRSGSLIASEHLHRYELAGSLCAALRVADVCCGAGYGSELISSAGAMFVLGVDIEPGVIATAEKELAKPRKLEFAQADAVEFLERELPDGFDAVVMFEGLEHVSDPERAIAALSRHTARGLRALVSIPNSVVLGEVDNPFHVTDYDYESARAALSRLGDDVVVLSQYLAEGSLIGSDGAKGLDQRLAFAEFAEPELCSHLLGAVNFDQRALERAATARMQLEVAPLNRRYMAELEAKVAKLWDELQQTDRDLRDTREELERIQHSVTWRATAPVHRTEQRLRRRRLK